MHPLTGQQQLTYLGRHHGGVITEHPSQSQLWKWLMAKGGRSRADITLRLKATGPPQGVHERQVTHAAIESLGKAIGRCSRDGT